MKTINTLKTSLIDKILAIDDQKLLEALQTIINTSSKEKTVKLNDAQKSMLQMSEDDIKYGRLTSQEELDEEDMAWLSEK